MERYNYPLRGRAHYFRAVSDDPDEMGRALTRLLRDIGNHVDYISDDDYVESVSLSPETGSGTDKFGWTAVVVVTS